MLDTWTRRYQRQREGKGNEKKQEVGQWRRSKLKWGEQVRVNRLRIGHTFITHSYLMNKELESPPPDCPLCREETLTVKHIFVECPVLARAERDCSGIGDQH